MTPRSPSPQALAPVPGRMLVLAGILLSAFNLRTAVTSLTPLLDVLGEEFGFGATVAGVLGMVPTAAFAVAGVGTPRLAHRLGLERTAVLSMALAATGLPTALPAGIDREALLRHMALDKKNLSSKLRFILPTAVGRSAIIDGIEPAPVRELLARA